MSQQQTEKTQQPAEQHAFNRIGQLADKAAPASKGIDKLFRPFFGAFQNQSQNWQKEAMYSLQSQKILRAKALLYGIVLTFLLLLVWSAFAAVDEVTRGEGKVIPSRQLQIIQTVDGGIVNELLVEEGQSVKQGQLLVRIDPTRFVSSFQEGSVRAFALGAKIERLQALINNEAYLPMPQSDPVQAQVIAQERNYYESSRAELDKRLNIAKEQLKQRQQELNAVREQLRTAEQLYEMSTQELQVTLPLRKSGAVSEMDILRLERDQSNADGERRQAAARSRQIEASILEAQARIEEVGLAARNQWRSELSEASSELNSLDKNIEGLADRVKYSEIYSPVNGTIQRVLLNTIGGVVQPGNAIIEIVPEDDRLLVEAKIAPRDVAFLKPGLPAAIKLHAYDFSIYGGLEATLQHISADTITDEQDNTYYLVRAITTDNDFTEHFEIIPGMTAQVDILTGKRTILSYLLKPITRAKANALSER